MAASRGEQVRRAELLADLGRYAEAVDEVRAHLDNHPADADALALLGYLHLRSDRPGEALASAEAALRHDPDHRVASDVRDQALVFLGRADEASAGTAFRDQSPGDVAPSSPGPAPVHGVPVWPESSSPDEPWGAARPVEPEPAPMDQLLQAFTRIVLFGSIYCWTVPVVIAAFGQSQLFAGVLGVGGLAGLLLAVVQLPGSAAVAVGALQRLDPWLARAALVVATGPAFTVGYAVTAYPWTLGAAIVAGVVALIIMFVVRADFSDPEP